MLTSRSRASEDADYLWNFVEYLYNEKKITFNTREFLQSTIHMALVKEDIDKKKSIQFRNDFLDHLDYLELQGVITQETRSNLWDRMFHGYTKRPNIEKEQ
jgi:hypothetical protein